MRGEKRQAGGQELFAMPGLLAAAHELKAPLVLMRQLAFEVEQAQGESDATRRMKFTSDRCLRLVTNLTRSARLEDGLFQLEPVEVKSVCDEVARELQPLAQEYGQRISVETKQGQLVSVAHKDLLHALLISLCDNALAHNKKGKDIVLSAQVVDGRIAVSVRDEGPKLAAHELSMLRKRLGTVQPLSARPRSSGLGLWIASKFAEAMSGYIGNTTHRTRPGMSFYVSLPISKQLSLFD